MWKLTARATVIIGVESPGNAATANSSGRNTGNQVAFLERAPRVLFTDVMCYCVWERSRNRLGHILRMSTWLFVSTAPVIESCMSRLRGFITTGAARMDPPAADSWNSNREMRSGYFGEMFRKALGGKPCP